MAAACITRNAVPWKPAFQQSADDDGTYFPRICQAILRNPASYYVTPEPELRRSSRQCIARESANKDINQSSVTCYRSRQSRGPVGRGNLKHTKGLKLLVVLGDSSSIIPQVEHLLKLEIVLFSYSRFKRLYDEIKKAL
ncbi:hypothetical protein B0H63DRAFT_91361 [Podospora didyma]|uniref:Uncharacterized protein n=1 Tax=Podospora didyma TaxID=330526 RepID=A0AAE0JZF1_9PEZI|nr:hypothetical protein B0H63DRAFT_91361 [Podospora didyma]